MYLRFNFSVQKKFPWPTSFFSRFVSSFSTISIFSTQFSTLATLGPKTVPKMSQLSKKSRQSTWKTKLPAEISYLHAKINPRIHKYIIYNIYNILCKCALILIEKNYYILYRMRNYANALNFYMYENAGNKLLSLNSAWSMHTHVFHSWKARDRLPSSTYIKIIMGFCHSGNLFLPIINHLILRLYYMVRGYWYSWHCRFWINDTKLSTLFNYLPVPVDSPYATL